MSYFYDIRTRRLSLVSWVLVFNFAMVLFWCLYILLVSANIIGSDHFQLVVLYDRILSGHESLLSLWEPKGGHRYPGYQLGFFANIKLGGFSARLESIIAILLFSLSVVFITTVLSRSVSSRRYQQILFVLFATLVMFNAQSLRLSAYSLIAMRLFNFAGFILVATLVYKLIRSDSTDINKIRRWIFFVLSVCCCYAFFGRGWGVAASLSLASIALLFTVSHREYSINSLVRLASIVFVILVFVALYFRGLSDSNGTSGMDLISISKYFFLKLGSANLSMFSSSIGRIELLALIVSIVYVVISLSFTFYFICFKRIDAAECLSLYLVYFSLFATVLVSFSRYDSSPFYPRHNIELSVGFLGIAFLIIKQILVADDRRANVLMSTLSATLTLALFINFVHVLSNYKYLNSHNQKVERRFVELLETKSTNKEKYRRAGCNLSHQACIEAFDIIKKRQILTIK